MAIGANNAEAQQAESKIDFIHKIKMAGKEAKETQYWLTICMRMENFEIPMGMIDEIQQINAIISKIIVSAKRKI
jgi:four helix bundle protein